MPATHDGFKQLLWGLWLIVFLICPSVFAEDNNFDADNLFADDAFFDEFDDDDSEITYDPFEGFNRAIFTFNDTMDHYVLKPVAQGYDAALPKPVKTGVSNFFNNLGEPLVIINDLLQGKLIQGLSDTGRFLINSTLGIYGLFDVAKYMHLPAHNEDFGQTLGLWGVGEGPYLVLPFLGPSNIRDGVGSAAAFYTSPISQIDETNTENKLRAVKAVDTRYNLLGTLDSLEEGALDPYAFMRDSFTQNRRHKIKE